MPGAIARPLIGFVGLLVVLVALNLLFAALVPWAQIPGVGVEARGRVVGHEPAGSGRVYPVVVFTTPDDELRFIASEGYRPDSLPVGAEVTVLYDPADPARARLGAHSDLAFNAALAVVLALIFGAGIARAMRRR